MPYACNLWYCFVFGDFTFDWLVMIVAVGCCLCFDLLMLVFCIYSRDWLLAALFVGCLVCLFCVC